MISVLDSDVRLVYDLSCTGTSDLSMISVLDRNVRLVFDLSCTGTSDMCLISVLDGNVRLVFDRSRGGAFSGLSLTSDFNSGTSVASLPGAWHCRVRVGTGLPGVRILWYCEIQIATLICHFSRLM